jgi:hypothetical protein
LLLYHDAGVIGKTLLARSTPGVSHWISWRYIMTPE